MINVKKKVQACVTIGNSTILTYICILRCYKHCNSASFVILGFFFLLNK